MELEGGAARCLVGNDDPVRRSSPANQPWAWIFDAKVIAALCIVSSGPVQLAWWRPLRILGCGQSCDVPWPLLGVGVCEMPGGLSKSAQPAQSTEDPFC